MRRGSPSVRKSKGENILYMLRLSPLYESPNSTRSNNKPFAYPYQHDHLEQILIDSFLLLYVLVLFYDLVMLVLARARN